MNLLLVMYRSSTNPKTFRFSQFLISWCILIKLSFRFRFSWSSNSILDIEPVNFYAIHIFNEYLYLLCSIIKFNFQSFCLPCRMHHVNFIWRINLNWNDSFKIIPGILNQHWHTYRVDRVFPWILHKVGRVKCPSANIYSLEEVYFLL